MVMKFPNKEDVCPLCGSRDLVYGSREFGVDFDYIEYPTGCDKCGASWVQRYVLAYDENIDVMDKDGNEVD